jgi:lipopolysaccharide biosynthesis regulator YciM
MSEWLFLLLPLAAASGWWAATRSSGTRSASGPGPDPAFLRGLNYLLNEQPDKAIDVFLKLAEVDEETVETHLALGSLFRRRGEVDRAIRIHQNLVARPKLDKDQRAFALYELGQDYMRAGLFDRAESLFGELVEMRLHRERALVGLREIYQQEKDWVRCLEVAEQLSSLTGEPMCTEIAHYHCELAEEALKTGDGAAAETHLQEAQAADRRCVRATMLQAQMAMARGDAQAAATFYQRVAGQGPEFLPEILPELMEAFRRSGRQDVLEQLRHLYRNHPSPALMLILADQIEREEGDEAALAFLINHVSAHADLAGLERLLELEGRRLGGDAQARAAHRAVLTLLRQLRSRQPEYHCEHCGFVARRLHWQCPSCKRWGTIRPLMPQPLAPDGQALPPVHSVARGA